jgi:hypothetical protein
MITAILNKKNIFNVQLNPKKVSCILESSLSPVKCFIIKNYITCTMEQKKIILKIGKVEIGNVHNHNNLYYQKSEAQEKLIYVSEYKAYEVN